MNDLLELKEYLEKKHNIEVFYNISDYKKSINIKNINIVYRRLLFIFILLFFFVFLYIISLNIFIKNKKSNILIPILIHLFFITIIIYLVLNLINLILVICFDGVIKFNILRN